jgi:hypothetical protein
MLTHKALNGTIYIQAWEYKHLGVDVIGHVFTETEALEWLRKGYSVVAVTIMVKSDGKVERLRGIMTADISIKG